MQSLYATSLKQELATRGSPIQTLFEQRLSNTAGVLDTATTNPIGFNTKQAEWESLPPADLLRALSSARLSDRIIEIEDYPWQDIGMAFDYRLRYFLDISPIESLVAYHGAIALGNGKLPRGFQELADDLDSIFRDNDPRRRQLPAEMERTLCRYCYVLALFEPLGRGGFDETWKIVRVGRRGKLSTLASLCRETYINDLVELGQVFLETQKDLLDQTVRVLNPKFATSRFVGMDADLIVGDRLLELKTIQDVKDFRAKSRRYVWQLVGYLLGDTDDSYHIREAGFYLSRQGAQLYWRNEDLLWQLAGGPVDLEQLRQEFLQACKATVAGTREALDVHGRGESEGPVVRHELRFFSLTAERGKRHVPMGEHPYLSSYPFAQEHYWEPACGTRGHLDKQTDPIVPSVGCLCSDVDASLCRRCLMYLAASY
jgi:hypothetical protein